MSLWPWLDVLPYCSLARCPEEAQVHMVWRDKVDRLRGPDSEGQNLMPLRQPSKTLGALRVLIQGSADRLGHGLAIELARKLAGNKQVVVVSAGHDLTGLAHRFEFLELVGQHGLPTRSLGEIGEEITEFPADVGALVVLDTAELYRATRCATRQASDRQSLSPGLWDEIAESAKEVLELATRRGIHQIWCAPTREDRGTNEDGDEVMLNSRSPKAWGDLPKSVHAWLEIDEDRARVRRDTTGTLERGQEWRIDSAADGLHSRLERVLGGEPRPSVATLTESTSAELAARDRRSAAGDIITERFCALAQVRSWRGPEGVEELRAEWMAERGRVSHEQLKVVEHALEMAATSAARAWAPLRAMVATEELSAVEDPARVTSTTLSGPCPTRCPETGDGLDPTAPLHDYDPGYIGGHAFATDLDPETRAGWVAAFARRLGVWTRASMSVLCSYVLDSAAASHAAQSGQLSQSTCPLLPRGKEWANYSDDDHRNLLAHLFNLASIEARYSPAPVSVHVEPEQTESPPAPPPMDDAVLDMLAAGVEIEPDPRPAAAPRSIPLPTRTEFAELRRSDAASYLEALITHGQWWGKLDQLRARAGATGGGKKVSGWSDDARQAVYDFLTGDGAALRLVS